MCDNFLSVRKVGGRLFLGRQWCGRVTATTGRMLVIRKQRGRGRLEDIEVKESSSGASLVQEHIIWVTTFPYDTVERMKLPLILDFEVLL